MRSLLPGSLRELADRISIQALIKLTETLGGTRVCIPNQPNGTSRLAAVLCQEDFAVLCHDFRGVDLQIPRAAALHRWLRDKQVLEQHAAGVSVRDLAMQMNIAERTVWSILARHREAKAKVRAAARVAVPQPGSSKGTSAGPRNSDRTKSPNRKGST